ncbi:MAG: hypothetical protein II783_01320 [Erysipelotrichales bacterium]|nr:hypothetical protein [Erysipelotrichales bacterium]
MKDKNGVIRLYNMILPIWLLVWWPSYLWLILIPLNYLWDRLMFSFALQKEEVENRKKIARYHTWEICLAGFAADFAGAAVLYFIAVTFGEKGWVYEHITEHLLNPFTDVFMFLLVCFSIAISGLLVYLLDGVVLRGAVLRSGEELRGDQIRKIAFWMAVTTAPYFYLVPVIV